MLLNARKKDFYFRNPSDFQKEAWFTPCSIMRNLLAMAGLASVIFLGLGWYLGWYKIQNASSPDGHRHIQIDVDTNKVKSDVGKGEAKIHDILTDGMSQQGGSQPGGGRQNGQSEGNGTADFSTTEDGGFVFPAGGQPPTTNGPLAPPAR